MENEISILVIEDEALIAETIQMMLKEFGYHIAGVCYRYETAAKAIDEATYDLVITDINLGDGVYSNSGLDLMVKLKKIKNCPFIFLTAFDDKETIQRATTLRPSAYLTKPIKAANLYASIQVAVENFQHQTGNSSPGYEQSNPDYIYVKLGKRLVKVVWAEVYYLEAIKNYVVIKSRGLVGDVLLRSSLLQVLQQMIPIAQRSRFAKISRAVVLDKTVIQSISGQDIITSYGVFHCSKEAKEKLKW